MERERRAKRKEKRTKKKEKHLAEKCEAKGDYDNKDNLDSDDNYCLSPSHNENEW